MKLNEEDLAELQRRLKIINDTPPSKIINGKNAQYEAKKDRDNFIIAMSVKYGFDYQKNAVSSTTGEIIPL